MSLTLASLRGTDSIGIPRFTIPQTKAIVDMVKAKGLLKSDPPECAGKGIVIAGGGKYLSHAWVCCRIIRATGCQLPIQIWHLGQKEMPKWAIPMFRDLGAEPVDAFEVMVKHPTRQMSGWVLKNYAIRHCPFEQVLFLDADCFPSRDPEPLLGSVDTLLFSDVARHAKTAWAWMYSGLSPWDKEGELGQYIVHKTKQWMGLRWALWYGEHADVWGTLVHGDKDWTLLGFRVSGVPFEFSPESEWAGWGIGQRWKGTEWFRHCMGAKRGEHPWPEDVAKEFWTWTQLTVGRG